MAEQTFLSWLQSEANAAKCALLRLIVGRRKYAWLVSLSALLLTAALAIYASTNPIPGNEGAGIRAIQSCCLFIGSVTTGRILWLKR